MMFLMSLLGLRRLKSKLSKSVEKTAMLRLPRYCSSSGESFRNGKRKKGATGAPAARLAMLTDFSISAFAFSKGIFARLGCVTVCTPTV